MTITKLEFLSRTKLDERTLDIWIEEEWLASSELKTERTFSEAEIARVKLISDLIEELGVNVEGVGIILHLLDQVHGLRSVMANILTSAQIKVDSNQDIK